MFPDVVGTGMPNFPSFNFVVFVKIVEAQDVLEHDSCIRVVYT